MTAPIPDASPVRPPISDIPAVPVRPSRAIQFSPEEFTKLLTSIATNAWKVRGRIMADPKGEDLREEIKKDDVKKIARHLDSIYEALTEFGIEIRDRTGEAYDYGLPDKIVSSVPQTGLTKELIVETLKPTIYWQSQIAQAGEVVIAVPAVVEEKKPEKI